MVVSFEHVRKAAHKVPHQRPALEPSHSDYNFGAMCSRIHEIIGESTAELCAHPRRAPASMCPRHRSLQSCSERHSDAATDRHVHLLEFTIICFKSWRVQGRKPYTITKAREKWTDAEHRLFLEGMKLYGRSWARVATHVQTKSTVQIRSHAQKYFNRLKRVQGASTTSWPLASAPHLTCAAVCS